ncbi:MAG: hypothetical protein Aurels2KO_39730 [Aureliella sp.]
MTLSPLYLSMLRQITPVRFAFLAALIGVCLITVDSSQAEQAPPQSQTAPAVSDSAQNQNEDAPSASSGDDTTAGENAESQPAAQKQTNAPPPSTDDGELATTVKPDEAGEPGDTTDPAPSQIDADKNTADKTDAGASTPGSPAAKESTANASALDGPVWVNVPTNTLMGAVLVILAIASLVGRYLRRQPTEYVNPALVRRFRQRLNAWWLMFSILVFGFVLQPIGTVVLFCLVSFWALREFITMTPTRRGDHRALFWALIVITPLQYALIALETSVTWRTGSVGLYGIYSILIPVYSSLLIPARVAISGDSKRFLERSAQITFGLLICVYSLSFAPALINLNLQYSDGTPFTGSRAGVLFFLILVSQLSEILQWTWGHLVGRKQIAPEVSSSRTWEGFAGGTLSTGMIGAALCWVTPFTFWEAACLSIVISTMGMFGGMTMSAIKRDRGVNDYGTLVLGHAGVLDRIDSLCFAAPVFYHLTRFYFT